MPFPAPLPQRIRLEAIIGGLQHAQNLVWCYQKDVKDDPAKSAGALTLIQSEIDRTEGVTTLDPAAPALKFAQIAAARGKSFDDFPTWCQAHRHNPRDPLLRIFFVLGLRQARGTTEKALAAGQSPFFVHEAIMAKTRQRQNALRNGEGPGAAGPA